MKKKTEKRVIAILLILIMICVAGWLSSSYRLNLKFEDCIEYLADTILCETKSATFLITNHDKLEFPSCFRDLKYTLLTTEPYTLYLFDGNFLSWDFNFRMHCWSESWGDFDCEMLCLRS